jgi:para-aminobenzoate synthetase/4-amino-4-deoxychorismate lyase
LSAFSASFGFQGGALSFRDPLRVVTCTAPSGLRDAFERCEEALKEGLFLAGFLSYEAGYAFEPRFAPSLRSEFPMLHFGCYRAPVPCPAPGGGPFEIRDLDLNVTRERYDASIGRIRDAIASGDVYQITYCIKHHFSFAGDPRGLFRALRDRQPVPYPAYLDGDGFTILSLSPEMFVRKRGGRVVTKPMKGTWNRGRGFLDDLVQRWRFRRDPKNRAENVMIVDLLRNDLGRVGRRVRVPRLYEVTGYRTLFQMTSTVEARVEPDLPLWDLFRAIFPSGSVTGAPKIRAMEIIREIEREDRHIYTGAIGYVTPDRDLYFNVPIRTILLRGGRGEMGVGGGIVWDSTPQGEWDEGMLKSRFLTEPF